MKEYIARLWVRRSIWRSNHPTHDFSTDNARNINIRLPPMLSTAQRSQEHLAQVLTTEVT
jgi:hypothetical protein